jgi:hypothetical protein
MRTAEEWFEEELSGEPLTQEAVIDCIRAAQKDTAEYIIKRINNYLPSLLK